MSCGLAAGICKARRAACSLTPLARRGQHPIVANTFDAGGQDVQHEAAHKLCAIKPHQALGVAVRTMIISAHRERHLVLADSANTLIADGRAVRVAAQVLQHLGRASQRRLGVHHPVVLIELALPLPPWPVLALRVMPNIAVLVRYSQRRHELAAKHFG